MANLANKDFSKTVADGHNYLLWAINVKIVLKVLLMTWINLIHKPIFQTQPNTLLFETSYSRISQDKGSIQILSCNQNKHRAIIFVRSIAWLIIISSYEFQIYHRIQFYSTKDLLQTSVCDHTIEKWSNRHYLHFPFQNVIATAISSI